MSNVVELIKSKVAENQYEGEALISQMDTIAEWDSIEEVISNINAVRQFCVNVILDVEDVCVALIDEVDGIRSGEKLDAAVEIVDDYIKLPFYAELIDGVAIRLLISFMVDILNAKFGKDWKLNELRQKVREGADLVEEHLSLEDE